MTDDDIAKLMLISRSRMERGSRVERAKMLLAYRENPSFYRGWGAPLVCITRRLSAVSSEPCLRPFGGARRSTATGQGADHHAGGPRPGWWTWPAAKAKDQGYPHELWTTRLLARHAREHGRWLAMTASPAWSGHRVQDSLARRKSSRIRCANYLERRDAEFERKMAEVLCVYREVQVLKRSAAKAKNRASQSLIVSYDEKPGIQAIATTSPDLSPKPGVFATFARDHEYKRHGTVSLLAGIDLLDGKVHALVRIVTAVGIHRVPQSSQCRLPGEHGIKLILDNHSAHISKETKAWLATQRAGRFESPSRRPTAPGSI